MIFFSVTSVLHEYCENYSKPEVCVTIKHSIILNYCLFYRVHPSVLFKMIEYWKVSVTTILSVVLPVV